MAKDEGARYTLAEIFKVFFDGFICGAIITLALARLWGL